MPRTASRLGGGTVTLDSVAFESPFNMPLVHEAVRAELNARRLFTFADLDRRRHRLRTVAPRLHVQGQPQSAARRLPQRAVGSRRA